MIPAFMAACWINAGLIALPAVLPASYEIRVQLNDSSRTLAGSQQIRFINPTSQPLESICFHLYPNAFKDTSTVFCRENPRTKSKVASGNIARLDLSEIKLNGIKVQPDNIEISGTLLYMGLPAPLKPGRSIDISMNFELLIPAAMERFGYDSNGNYIISHWYPIICGYQKGELIDREYHSNSEFFSNFSKYDVTVALPADFKFGSTGEFEQISSNDSVAVWHAAADTVIDFAFVCGPRFTVFETDTLGIRLYYMLTPNGVPFYQKTDSITKYSLAYLSDRLFQYPYKNYIVADINSGSQGLELPGLVAVVYSGSGLERTAGILEVTIAHETAHQWFYGMIATNETDDPWLDEGFASYYEDKIIESFGEDIYSINLAGWKIPISSLERNAVLQDKASFPIDMPSWEYPSWGSYSGAVYGRARLVLESLEYFLGQDSFDKAMKDYAVAYRFGHPDSDDLRDVLEASTERELLDFFNMFVKGTARIDYSVESLEFREITGDSILSYLVTVHVKRELDGKLPQVLSVGLADGARIDTLWDGRAKFREFEFRTGSIPEFAALDMVQACPLDENMINNSLYRENWTGRIMAFEWDSIFIIELLASLLL